MSDSKKHPGDDGTTVLIHGEQVDKNDPRLDAVGTLDEMNSFIGLALAHGVPEQVRPHVLRLQRLTFDIGMLVVCGANGHAKTRETGVLAVIDGMIDEIEKELPELHRFVIPGGTPAAAALHVARTVCRRAERHAVAVQRIHGLAGDVIPAINRGSTVLFILARACNYYSSREEETV